jgi:GNAT superfamily N-acetyltransferase
MSYTIRATSKTDIEKLPEIERQANTLFVGYTGESHVMSADHHRCYWKAGRSWVATDENDQPVGFAVADLIGGQAHLHEVDVHPDHGRRGLGRALVERVIQWACERGLPAITLTTERDIPWNAPFYAKLGFVIVPSEEWTFTQRTVFERECPAGHTTTRVLMIKRLHSE